MPKHNSKNKVSSSHTIIDTAPKALLIMLLSGLLILTISAFFALRTTSPYSLARPLALAALYVGAILGGVFCSLMLNDGDSYIASLSSACALALLILAAKAFIPNGGTSLPVTLSAVLHMLIPASAALGTLLGKKRPRSKKRRKR